MDYFAHQSNLRVDTTLGGMKNEFIFGVEYTNHKVLSGNYAITNSAAPNCKSTAGVGANNAYCFINPNGSAVTNLASLAGRSASRLGQNQDWRVKTVALTAMDTVDLTDKLSAFGGMRADRFDLDLKRFNNLTNTLTGDYGYKDTLVNGHFGLTYKVGKGGVIYASAATAQDINGGEADSGTNSGYGGAVLYQGQIAGAKPETSRNYEIGTKWNLLGDQLLATAALFQTTKTDVMEGANYDTVGTFNTGKNRVHGVEFGLSGELTDQAVGAGRRRHHEVQGARFRRRRQHRQPAVELRRALLLGAGQVPADRRLLLRRHQPLREQPLRRPARHGRRLHATAPAPSRCLRSASTTCSRPTASTRRSTCA